MIRVSPFIQTVLLLVPAAKANATEAPVSGLGTDGGSLLALLNPQAIPLVLLMFFVAWLLVRGIGHLGNRLAERMVSRRLQLKNLVTILGFAIYSATIFLALTSLFRFSAQALFALSGTLAVALGFALKDMAASLIAGVAILVTKPFQVGDRIQFGSHYGEVVEIGLRKVQLITLDDNLVTIPTNKFLTEPVASANAGSLDCMVVMPFYLSPQADHRRARAIVHDAVLASKYLYLQKPLTVLVANSIGDDGHAYVVLTAKAYVYDMRHEKAFASDVTDRVLPVFRKEGIPMAGM